MALRSLWWLPAGSVREVTPEQLHQSLSVGPSPQILDVRTLKEWQKSHIAGSINLPIFQLKSGLSALPLETDRPIVAICLSAHRSIPAVRLLLDRSFADVAQLAGGMRAWWAAGLPTTTVQKTQESQKAG
jgi:rhodanese-related sulfurtransferase